MILLFTFSTINSNAQQNPEYTQYMYNTIAINPGYTGSVGTLEANLLLRKQWVGIDGAPKTNCLSLHGPVINKNIGIDHEKHQKTHFFSMEREIHFPFQSYNKLLKLAPLFLKVLLLNLQFLLIDLIEYSIQLIYFSLKIILQFL